MVFCHERRAPVEHTRDALGRALRWVSESSLSVCSPPLSSLVILDWRVFLSCSWSSSPRPLSSACIGPRLPAWNLFTIWSTPPADTHFSAFSAGIVSHISW